MEKYVEVFFLNIVKVMGLKPRDSPIPVILLKDEEKRVLAVPLDDIQYFVIKDVLEKRDSTITIHDFLLETLRRLDVKIDKTLIYDLHDDRYHMNVILKKGKVNETVIVECRPIDAITLSILAKAPIFVEELILEKTAFDASEVLPC